jgi:hypothetical protein
MQHESLRKQGRLHGNEIQNRLQPLLMPAQQRPVAEPVATEPVATEPVATEGAAGCGSDLLRGGAASCRCRYRKH